MIIHGGAIVSRTTIERTIVRPPIVLDGNADVENLFLPPACPVRATTGEYASRPAQIEVNANRSAPWQSETSEEEDTNPAADCSEPVLRATGSPGRPGCCGSGALSAARASADPQTLSTL